VHLVSFDRCPYVQRALLVCREKGVQPEVTYIDLADKPAWFLEKSPRGKVPILEVDGQVLFESQAICEYLDEVHPDPPLMPDTPLLRARDRAWFLYATDVVLPLRFEVAYGTDEASWVTAVGRLAHALRVLEGALDGRDWFSGDGSRFGMADVGLAPVVTHMELARRNGRWNWPDGIPAFRAWVTRMLQRPTLAQSVPDGFEEAVLAYQRGRDAVVLGQPA